VIPVTLFEQAESPCPKDDSCYILSHLVQQFLRRRYFKHFPISLCNSLNPYGGIIHNPRDLIWINLNFLAPMMLYTKYQCIPASGSWEEDFWRFIKIVLILLLIGPEKGPASLVEHIWIPIPQAWFLPSLVENGLVILEKKSFKGKMNRRTNERTDGRTNCDGKSSLEPLAQVN